MTFEFECTYQDGQIIRQLAGTPNEINFGDLDLPKIKSLFIEGKGKVFGVDVEGNFNINGLNVRFADMPAGVTYRPIYFRRVKQTYYGGIVETITKYAVGIQATVENKNLKKILMVDDYGNLEILND